MFKIVKKSDTNFFKVSTYMPPYILERERRERERAERERERRRRRIEI